MSNADPILPSCALTWPIRALWRFVGLIVRFVGCLLAIVLGLVFMGIGVLFTSTFVGAIIGIPLFVLGAFLVIRGLF